MSASPSPDASAHTAPHTTQIDTMTSAPTTTPLRLADVEDVAASSHSMPPASPKVSNAARNQFPKPSIGVASEDGASRFCFTAIVLRGFGFYGITDEPPSLVSLQYRWHGMLEMMARNSAIIWRRSVQRPRGKSAGSSAG